MSTARAQIVIGADSRDAEKGLASLDRKMQDFGKSVTSAGKSLTKYITLPLAGLATTVIKFGADFEKSMTQSIAIMGDVSDAMRKDMEDAARAVARTTSFSAKEAADSYFYLASAGLDAVASIEAMPRVAAFAQAGAFDMARATDLLTDAQSALGLAVDDTVQNMANMTRVSDVLVKANTLANSSVEQFSEALTNKAGAALRLLNKDIEEGMAVLAVFADQGLKGAAAGEALNIVMRDLQRTSLLDDSGQWEKMGLEVYDAAGNMRSMVDIIRDLEDAFDGMSDMQLRSTLMQLGFQDRSVSSMMALLGLSDQIEEYETQLRQAGGVTDEVANKQLQNFWDQLGLVKDQLVDVGLSLWELGQPILMDTVLPALEQLVGYVEQAVEWFDELDKKTQTQVAGALGLAAALGPVLIIVGKLISVIGALGIKFVLIAAAIGGLIAILVKLWNTNEEFRDAVMEIWQAIQDKALEIWEKIQGFWEEHGDAIIQYALDMWEKIKEFWDEHGQAIIDIAMAIWHEIEEIFTTLWLALVDIFGELWKTVKFLWEKIKEFWDRYGEDILKQALIIWNLIKDVVLRAINFIKDIIGLVLAIIRGDWDEAWNRIVSILENAWGLIGDVLRFIIDTIKGSFGMLPKIASDAAKGFINAFTDKIKAEINAVKDAARRVADAVRNFLPFSPAKEGPLKDLDKLDFGGPMVKSMENALPKVQGMMDKLMTPGLTLQAAGGSFESHREIIIEVPVHLNSREFARATAREMDSEFHKLSRR